MYNDNLDETKVTGDLLIAADYYNVSELVNFCVIQLSINLTEINAAEIMVSSYFTNQKELFCLACKFVSKQKLDGKFLKKEALEKMKEKDPNLAWKMVTEALFNIKL